MRILIIEDTDSIRRMLTALVSARADQIDAVATGEEGLLRAARNVPDVVLLDLNLPGLYNGLEVCSRLRADPKTKKVVIFVVSAAVDAETQQRARQAGATAFFPKPFSPMAILKEIDNLRGPHPAGSEAPAPGGSPGSSPAPAAGAVRRSSASFATPHPTPAPPDPRKR